MSEAVILASRSYYPDENENVLKSIFQQYERVIIQSLITSFGLDFLVKDHLGGDVDTIHNVRKEIYQRADHKIAYDNRGEYDSHEYHSAQAYRDKNKQISQQRKDGKLTDSYTGEKIARNGKSDLDHVISAKEIHDDRGRVLAGLKGSDLANSDENLKATNPHTNRTKKAMSMDEFLDKYGDEYTEEQKNSMRKQDAIARRSYEAKLAKEYYTSPAFAKDVTKAAGKVGVQMGLRQLIGFVFAEIWFSVKAEFERLDVKPGLDMDMGDFFTAIGNGVKNGYSSAKSKYKELFAQFATGTFSGVLASLTTTVCNIFFTTAKNAVKVIRESFSSIVQAGKILLINPDNYPFGERMRQASMVLAAGAGIVIGGLVSEMISKTPIGAIPAIGGVVQTFCGTLCTGIVSCTLLYFLDRSKIMNTVVNSLDLIRTVEDDIDYYKKQALFFEKYAAELMELDPEKFRRETSAYAQVAANINDAATPQELNAILKNSLHSLGIKMSWEETHSSFCEFMGDKKGRMVFG